MSKRPFLGQILQLSAKSEEPLEDEILRDFAQAIGESPDEIVKAHQELRIVFEGKVMLGPVPPLKKNDEPTED